MEKHFNIGGDTKGLENQDMLPGQLGHKEYNPEKVEIIKKETELKRKVLTLDELPNPRMDALEDILVILPDQVLSQTEGGIHIPESSKEKMQPARGTIICVGPGKDHADVTLIKIYNLLLQVFRLMSLWRKTDPQELPMASRMPFKRGDRVLYGHYSGTSIEDPDGGHSYLIMRKTDVFIKLHQGAE